MDIIIIVLLALIALELAVLVILTRNSGGRSAEEMDRVLRLAEERMRKSRPDAAASPAGASLDQMDPASRMEAVNEYMKKLTGGI